MRIRSIKPEFWASEDIASLSWEDRLLFIGLWSYVDDNGVGRDNPKLVVADLFPLEDDPRDTLAKVSRGLQTLADARLIERYQVDGKPYLHITTWDIHQRIDRPGKPRYPLPTCENAIETVHLDGPSRQSREGVDAGTGEQGNRGTGDSATRGAKPPAPPPADDSAQTLVGEWIDHCGERPPGRVVGQVAKEIGAMLREGIPLPDVRAGLAAWHQKSLHPSALASVVHEIRTASTRPRAVQHNGSKTDAAIRELAERYPAGTSQQLPIGAA